MPDRPRSTKRVARPVGRPPGVDGQETRERIIEAARACFSLHGYAATTNRMIADRAGLTTAAVYHHFGKKQELMGAVADATEGPYLDKIRAAVEAADGFAGKAAALLDVIHAVARDHPDHVVFAGLLREEARRHPELSPIVAHRPFTAVFAAIVDAGVQSGEIHPSNRSMAQGAIAALALGATISTGDLSLDAHAVLTEGAKRVIAHTLDRPSSTTGGRRRATA